jgi:hypothetical protein
MIPNRYFGFRCGNIEGNATVFLYRIKAGVKTKHHLTFSVKRTAILLNVE